MGKKKGYVYIVSNEDFKGKNCVKIGCTGNLSTRFRNLNNAVPHPYKFHAIARTAEYKKIEKDIQEDIDTLLKKSRIDKTEFFTIEPEKACEHLDRKCKKNYPDAVIEIYKPSLTLEDIKKADKSGSRYDFESHGISIGETLIFKYKQKEIKVKVVKNNEIEHNGKRMSLSKFAKREIGREEIKSTNYFYYKGNRLSEIKTKK